VDDEAQNLASRLLALLKWERANLPFNSSMLARDVMLYALAAQGDQQSAGIKQFYLTLGYSEDHAGQMIRQLCSEGWLVAEQHPTDRRSKIIKPSDKLLSVFQKLREQMLGLVAHRVN